MLIIFCTNDLVFPSRAAAIAKQLESRMETAMSADAAVAKLQTTTEPTIVILDLNSSAVQVNSIVPRLQGLKQPPKAIIAFGPHVHADKLKAAEAAGCNLVLTRGQFDSNMEAILRQFAEEIRS
ncbi:MAG TPA: hypothetical protein VGJ15_07590 [Pirellulales bacterium]|jgi:CheY-like chemotaxis protein